MIRTRRTLPFALVAGAAMSATPAPAHAYESVNAATHDGHNDPKPPQKPQPAAPPRERAPEPAPPPPRQATPPPRTDAAPIPVATAVGQVAKGVKHGARSLKGDSDRGTHEPRHQPRIGHQPEPAPTPAPASVTALSHKGYDKPARDRGARRPREPQPTPTPTGSVTALSHKGYDRPARDRGDHQPRRSATTSVTARNHDWYGLTPTQKRKRILNATYPNSGVPMADFQLPRELPDAGESSEGDGAVIARSDNLRGFSGREFAYLTASNDKRRTDIDIGWPPPQLGRVLTAVGYGGKAWERKGNVPKVAATAAKWARRVNRFGFEYKRYAGTEAVYSAMLGAGHADRLAEGQVPSPSPLDPGTIHKGEWLMLGREAYTGRDGMVKVVLEGRDVRENGERRSMAVQRRPGGGLRLWAGDEETLYRHLSLGAGIPGLELTLEDSDESSGMLRSVDVRGATPAGRRALLRSVFIGRLPAASRPGVRNTRYVDSYTYAGGDEAVVGAPGGPVHDADRYALIRHPGRPARFVKTANSDGVSMLSSREVGPNARPGKARYSMMLEDANPGEPYDMIPGDEDVDARLDFTAGDLRSIRRGAWATAVNMAVDQGAEGVTVAGIKDAVRSADTPWEPDVDGRQIGLDSWTLRLGRRRKPAQILNYLYESQYGDANMAIQNLAPAFWTAESANGGDWPAALTVLGPSDPG